MKATFKLNISEKKIKHKYGLEENGPVQKYIDKTVIDKSDPYVPYAYVVKKPVWRKDASKPWGFSWAGSFRETGGSGGYLRRSAYKSDIGSGKIVYAGPYARFQYYGKKMIGSYTGSVVADPGEKKVLTTQDLQHQGGPQRGAYWFERMKKKHKKEIIKGANEVAKREGERKQ